MHRNIGLASLGGMAAKIHLRFRRLRPLAPIGILLTTVILMAPPALADGGAVMTVSPQTTAFFCGQDVDVTYGYSPDPVDTPVLRGYSIRVIAPYGLTFDSADVIVNSPLPGSNDTYFVVQNGINDCTIDFTFLDPGIGLSAAADLFTITMRDRGFNIPNTLVGINSGRFRNPDNQDFTVNISSVVEVDVICVAPTKPTLAAEPQFTPGTTNTLTWSDESIWGAVEYNVYMSTAPGFAVIADQSGWIPGLSHQFTGLADGQVYYFKVQARNFTQKVSNDSNVEHSTQDSFAPTTSVDSLDPDQYLLDWDLTFQATDAISGFDKLELFYRHDGGTWTSYGEYSTGPIAFSATDGDGLYEFYTVGTDVAGNQEIAPAGAQASTTLDTSQPYGTFAVNAGAEATNNPAVTLVVSVIRAVEMRFSNDGTTWPEGWVPLAGVHPWNIPATEENHTVYGEFRDAALQVMPVTDDIIFDVTETGPVSAPTAAPGHQTVLLTWTNPPDADFHSVDIWRGLVHDGSYGSTYPTYVGNVVPTLPVDRDAAQASPEWEQAGRSEFGATSFIDSVATRGIYLYEFFAADPASNFSVPTGTVTLATNYILGDVTVPFDGLVKVEDGTLLGAVYGLVGTDPLFNPDCDVAPTSNGSGTGIPVPNGQIDLGDQMIFAMNYLPPAKNLAGGAESSRLPGPAALSWKTLDGMTWALDLVAPCPQLKGVGLSLRLPAGVVPQLAAGDAITSQPEPFFLGNADRLGLQAGLVIWGAGRGISGTGTLLTVTLPAGSGLDPLAMQEISLDLRDVDNRPVSYDLQGKSGAVPAAAFWLAEAYPNPFNPTSTIRFSIPGEMPVRLEIYGMDGRRVAVLVDETLGAGPHESVWLGRDDTGRQVASGVYFSKLLAGSQSVVRKLTLMK